MPFSNRLFQQLVADIQGCNCDIHAPVLAFIAYKLSALLSDEGWNVVGDRLTEDVAKSGSSYGEFLELAIRMRSTTIAAAVATAADDDESEPPPAMWLRVTYNMDVRSCCRPFLCVH